jgi:hypothetical protein
VFLVFLLAVFHFENSAQKTFSNANGFGKDIIINDIPVQNQMNNCFATAYNGWLYAAYTYRTAGGYDSLIVRKSEDSGLTWNTFIQRNEFYFGQFIVKMDIVVCGYNSSSLKLFIAFIKKEPPFDVGYCYIYRYNASTGQYEAQIFPQITASDVHDFAIDCDCVNPAANSSPFSLGFLYADHQSSYGDSLWLYTSGDGGLTFSKRRRPTSSPRYHDHLSLTYGVSASNNTGRYYCSWQEREYIHNLLGNIFTSHTNPYFNSFFTKPICLDSINMQDVNMFRGTSISCQKADFNNDSADMTLVVLGEKFNAATQDYSVVGYYNSSASNSKHFSRFTLADSAGTNYIQPDIDFNSFDTTFMATVYDSTGNKIPYLVNNYNLKNANTWEKYSSKINDTSNLSDPRPQIRFNPVIHVGAVCWKANRPNDNAFLLYDYPLNPLTGYGIYKREEHFIDLKLFPNPVKNELNIIVKMKNGGPYEIDLYNNLGVIVKTEHEFYLDRMTNLVKMDLNNYPSGIYLLSVSSGNYKISKKIIKIN